MRNYIQLLPDKPSWEFSEPWSGRDGYTTAVEDGGRERARKEKESTRANSDDGEGEGDGRRIRERHYTQTMVYSTKCSERLGTAICRVTYARKGRLSGRPNDSGGYKIHHRRFERVTGRYDVILVGVVFTRDLSLSLYLSISLIDTSMGLYSPLSSVDLPSRLLRLFGRPFNIVLTVRFLVHRGSISPASCIA